MKTTPQVLTSSCKQAITSKHPIFVLFSAIADIKVSAIAFMSSDDMAMERGQKCWWGGKEKSREGSALGGHELGHCTRSTKTCSMRVEWQAEFQEPPLRSLQYHLGLALQGRGTGHPSAPCGVVLVGALEEGI